MQGGMRWKGSSQLACQRKREGQKSPEAAWHGCMTMYGNAAIETERWAEIQGRETSPRASSWVEMEKAPGPETPIRKTSQGFPYRQELFSNLFSNSKTLLWGSLALGQCSFNTRFFRARFGGFLTVPDGSGRIQTDLRSFGGFPCGVLEGCGADAGEVLERNANVKATILTHASLRAIDNRRPRQTWVATIPSKMYG